MDAKDNRQLNHGHYVGVYRNLHKGQDFSVRDAKSRLVLATGTDFVLNTVQQNLSLAGQHRVRDAGRKNVHCLLQGYFGGHVVMDTTDLDELHYNPYVLDSFINRRTNERVTHAEQVYFSQGKAWIVN